ncbi:hypothetical protein KBZ10_25380 [Streptomyces sp. F63]|uniref:Tc toxin subunit A-related protein n=1 Tax=Streptomyces sp. F63 TaxID=2824887 RepID=UPI001B38FA3A|nr:neuraminidase-like domain-containing protein [Streptomyces sp. F63]MBQ0987789.1 hypothetical protein [Streptomyces sp. F63]
MTVEGSPVRLLSSEFAAIYDARPDFDVVAEDLFDAALLESIGVEHGSGEHDALLGWQRLLRLHPEESAAKLLHADGLRSANAVARVPVEHFVADYGERFSHADSSASGDAVARAIHRRATAVQAKTAHAFADLIGMLSPQVRRAPFNNASPQLADDLRRLPSFEELFGSQDFLGCPDCCSIFGPAAYFTDLMRIVDRYVTDPASGNAIPSGMRLEDRRPDLFAMKLDCACANDGIPYLTLINEVLTALVAPERGPDQAARVLAGAVYPFNAPFNLPLSRIREVLRQLGTSTTELWRTCGTPVHAGTAQGYAGRTLTLDSAASTESGAYARTEVLLTGGAAAGQRRRIVSYDGPGRTATLDRSFDPAPGDPPEFLLDDPLERAREALGLTGEALEILLASPVDASAPALLSAQYGVSDIRSHLPRAGTGTLTVSAGSSTVRLSGEQAVFSSADVGSQLLIGTQLRTVARLDPADPTRAEVDRRWDRDDSGGYRIYPRDGFDRAQVFAQRVGLTEDQLTALFRQCLSDAELTAGAARDFYINGTDDRPPMRLELDRRDPGNTVQRVTDLTLERLDRLSRFIRLANTTGIGYEDLDWAMRCGGAQHPITPQTIERLAALVRLAEETGLSVRAAAAFLGDLKTTGRGDGPDPADPFDEIYNKPVLLGGKDPYAPGSSTPFDPARSPVWAYGEHDATAESLRRRLGAALALGDDDLTALAFHCAGPAGGHRLPLDLPTLSRFHRIAAAARLARWSVRDLLRLVRAVGSGGPDDPDSLRGLLEAAAWVDVSPFTLDDVLEIVSPHPVTPDQERDVRGFAGTLSTAATGTAVTPEVFWSATISAQESAALTEALRNRGVLNHAGIIGDTVLDHALATTLLPFGPDAFAGELIDAPASAAIVEALTRHDPPYLSTTPGDPTEGRGAGTPDGRHAGTGPDSVFLTPHYRPEANLDFLFPAGTSLRQEKTDLVRGLLSRTAASIDQVLTGLLAACAAQDGVLREETARSLAVDTGTGTAMLGIATGTERLTGCRQLLLTPLPSDQPLPEPTVRLVTSLWRTRRWVTALEYSGPELTALSRRPSGFDVADPAAPSVADLRSLAAFRTLTIAFDDTTGGLLRYLTGIGTDPAAELALVTGWEEAQLQDLITARYPLGNEPVRSVAVVAALRACFVLSARVNADVRSLLRFDALRRLPVGDRTWQEYEAMAQAALGMLGARQDGRPASAMTDCVNATDTLYRDVLLARVIWRLAQNDPSITGPESLCSRLLIDVEMSACDTTSRLSQAISSVQLYLQRCHLGLEPGVVNLKGIAPQWWEWAEDYRAWQTSRKVFLYPENYLDPTLRRRTSPQFAELKEGLTQTQITDASVTTAYARYFQALTDLAALVPCAAFTDVTPAPSPADRRSTLYLLARTRTAPYTYYYLTREDGDRWTPWQKIELTINSEFVTPVVAFDKLFLFWSEIEVIKSSAVSVGGQAGDNVTAATQTQTVATATLRYAFRTLTGNWTSPQTLADRVPIRVLPQPSGTVLGKNPDLASLFNPDHLIWRQPQAVKVSRGLRGRARVTLHNEPDGNWMRGWGEVKLTAGSTTVQGLGTRFNTQLRPGCTLSVGKDIRQVVKIRGEKELVVDKPFTATGVWMYTYQRLFGKVSGLKAVPNGLTSFDLQVCKGDTITCGAQRGVVRSVDSAKELTMEELWAWRVEASEYRIVPADPRQTRFKTFTGPGTISVSNTEPTVSGTGTKFLEQVSIGDRIVCDGYTRTVTKVGSNNNLYVDQACPESRQDLPYIVVPQERCGEQLLVQLGPPVEVSNTFVIPSWTPPTNDSGDPYTDALGRLNTSVSDALSFCQKAQGLKGQVGAGVGFLIDEGLNSQEARFHLPPDDSPYPGAAPYAGTLDDENSMLIVGTVDSSMSAEYWMNSDPGHVHTGTLPANPVPLLFNVSADAAVRNVANVTGSVLFDNGDEAFLLESQESGTWPLSDRITAVPYPLDPKVRGGHTLATDRYVPDPHGVRGVSFAVTRLTTGTIDSLGRQLLARGVSGLLTPEAQLTREAPFKRFYQTPDAAPPPTLDAHRLPTDQLSFTGPFGLYQREVFFHTPYLAAALLTANSRYDEARQWYQYIFDPTAEPRSEDGDGTNRFWRYLPFRGVTVPALLASLTDPAGIRAYNDDPLDPFAIADVRTSAYAKSVVMRYVQNLVSWGDSLFAQDTRESIGQAANLYMAAAELLGPRPRRLGDSPRPAPKSFAQIRAEYRGRHENIPQFLIDLEHTPLGSLGPDERTYATTPINDIDAYFCVPANHELDDCWALIEDRLAKIRTCQNLQGVNRSLPLFAPPGDTRTVIARAQWGGTTGADIPVGIPNYRFSTLIEQARQLSSQVIQFGAELLAALERKDAEDLALLQNRQQQALLDLATGVRRDQVNQLLATQDSLAETLAAARYRETHYKSLLATGLIPAEVANLRASEVALVFNSLSVAAQTASAIAFALPNVGSPFAMTYGGEQIGSATQAAAGVLQFGAATSQFAAERTLLMANYDRRSQEWQLQANLAGHEAQQIQAQLDANQSAIKAAQQEYTAHLRSLEQSTQTDRFLREKFTSRELYSWMARRLSALYFQLYRLAQTSARLAERAYQTEVGSNRRFITPDCWDDTRSGLVAGESLSLAVGSLQRAYLDEYVRGYEIQRTISLLGHDPTALLNLRTTGECVFDLPERLYDQDFPGHYRRAITSVAVTIPALVGPYQNIRGTLTQLGSQILLQANRAGVAYLLGDTTVQPPGPEVLRSTVRAAQSIALSTGMEDDGVFDVSKNDGRYLPFERTGAVSQWRLRIPFAANQIDFEAISDVVLTVRYNALDGGDVFRGEVQRLLPDYAGRQFVSLAQQYPADWHGFLAEPEFEAGNQLMRFQLPRTLLPPHVDPRVARVVSLYLSLRTTEAFPSGGPFVSITLAPHASTVKIPFRDGYAGSHIFPAGTGPLLCDLVGNGQTLGFSLSAIPDVLKTADGSRLREDAIQDVNLVIDFVGPLNWPRSG